MQNLFSRLKHFFLQLFILINFGLLLYGGYEIYQIYFGKPPDRMQALIVKAERGDTNAIFLLGQAYHFGHYGTKDTEKARYWYEKSVEEGNTKAYLMLARLIGDAYKLNVYDGKMNEEMEALLVKGAEAGDDEIKRMLGSYYLWSKEPPDPKQAYKYLIDSAKNENAISQRFIGAIFEKMETEEGKKRAFYWFAKASLNGDPQSQSLLADRYRLGWGVEKDNLKSIYWYEKARENDLLNSAYNIMLAYYYADQYLKAGEYLKIAAEEKDQKKDGEYSKSFASRQERYCLKYFKSDLEKAIKPCLLSAYFENGTVEYYAGLIIRNGHYEYADKAESVTFFEKSARRNYLLAQIMLMQSYYKGDLVEQDMAEAYMWYKLIKNNRFLNPGEEGIKEKAIQAYSSYFDNIDKTVMRAGEEKFGAFVQNN